MPYFFAKTATTKQLTPRQVYHTLIGLLVSREYRGRQFECHEVIFDSDNAEVARIYSANGDNAFVLYYPGSDEVIDSDDDYVKVHKPAKSLKHIIECVQTWFVNQKEYKLHSMVHLFVIAEANKRDHFIQATISPGKTRELITDDSTASKYDLTNIKDFLNEKYKLKKHTHYARWWQKITDTWQCGYYAIRAIEDELEKVAKDQRKKPKIDKLKRRYDKALERGNRLIKTSQGQEDNEQASDGISVISDSEFASGENIIAAAAPPKTSFFTRHPNVRLALIALGIGAIVGVAALVIISTILITSGAAIPFYMGAGAAVGAYLGVGGAAGAALGSTAIGAGVVAGFGVVTAAATLVVHRAVTGIRGWWNKKTNKNMQAQPVSDNNKGSTQSQVIARMGGSDKPAILEEEDVNLEYHSNAPANPSDNSNSSNSSSVPKIKP